MGFVLDFYSPDIRLAIEIDGGYHQNPDQIDYDKARQKRQPTSSHSQFSLQQPFLSPQKKQSYPYQPSK
ncbi:hypothetical protein COT42_02350 [Candidatus Saganbacteria bacterium CG08_land_8_20_14_0_20_45_16]|uniref:DUF559 domain-containing protein n=1 Tax=Candidatus Saganbacteria bacterium CG08_land_8_20_14_0_20_45_16 TaxID=2014293 RepID=A0A2H0Y071_UNCSA|nr:MAG: hypothetical protein COT42_02350 [Candidatus Saganbacteria bacterium CG08_land_8_20_14_0_20_45_16]